MEVRVIGPDRAEVVGIERLTDVLADPDALVWLDIPTSDGEAVDILREVFGFHPTAIRECVDRQRMPKVHGYADHVFVVLHAPAIGEHGHVHYVELDQFIGQRYLVTVHGPTNPAVAPDVPLQNTDAVWARIRAGRLCPTRPMQITHAITTAMTLGMEETLETVTADVWSLEQRVTAGQMGDPETFLDEMFRTRHSLLAVANIASTALEVHQRMDSVARSLDSADRALLADCADEFHRVHRMATEQRDYLQGVIEFYRTRTDTKMTVAAERLAVIAVVTLPITALASVLGMNLIANDLTRIPALLLALVVMGTMSAFLLRWARQHGWW